MPVAIRKIRVYGNFTKIRKVFRQKKKFACGMCRILYDYQSEAHGCLNDCILFMLREYPVVLRHSVREGDYFLCKLCARRYNDRIKAEICGDECKQRIFGIANKYAEVTPSEKPKNRPERRQYIPLVAVPAFKRPGVFIGAEGNDTPEEAVTEEAVTEEVVSEEIAAGEATEQVAAEGAGAEAAPADEAAPDVEEKPTRNQKKKWHRSDAKYACETCQQLHFTRMEAETCWESHSGDFNE